jgi:hypothetical protein
MKYAALLQKLNPDADSLVALLSKQVDNEMLRSIAGNDYGFGVDLHFKALCQIRDTHIVPAPMEWHPREVLELERWYDPPPDDKKSRARTQRLYRAHLVRAFACAVLLRAVADPLNYFGGDNTTIAILLERLLSLDASIQAEALRFFAWRAQSLNEWDNENPFYILALLVLVLRTQAKLTRIELKHLIDWVYASVRTVYSDRYGSPATRGQWLPWLTYYEQRHAVWQKIGLEIASHADRYGNSEGRQNLKALARHLETINPESD